MNTETSNGAGAVRNIIDAFTANMQLIGVSVLILVGVAGVVIAAGGLLGQNGSLRKHTGMIVGLFFCSILFGAITTLVPVMTDIGEDATSGVNGTTNQQQTPGSN
jgi:hypothetical protein